VQLAAQLPAEVPGLLWVFGEHGQSVVMVATENQVFPHHAFIPSVESQARINEASRLFPEAHIAKIEEEFWKANQ
jgi:hypothetical protein